MAAFPPSYPEATARVDWADLVAPYVVPSDYPALCLVSKHFWSRFAPRLWRDAVKTARLAGLKRENDLTWWLNFVHVRLGATQQKTRALARVLDLRDFGRDTYHFTFGVSETTINKSFAKALELLPHLTCILIDGHKDIDASRLLRVSAGQTSHQRPRLLSIRDCPTEIPGPFHGQFRYSLRSLVYLDISGISASLATTYKIYQLENLRILKARNCELTNEILCNHWHLQQFNLWSLDVCDNKLTDAVVDFLWNPRSLPLRRPLSRFQVEGELVDDPNGSTSDYGSFETIKESDLSKSFSHPERYLVDSPMYMEAHDDRTMRCHRLSGQGPVRQDSVDFVLRQLSGDDTGSRNPLETSRQSSEMDSRVTSPRTYTISHLHLSNNHFTSLGIERLLRSSCGQIEHLTCDSVSLLGSSQHTLKSRPKKAKLDGILGAAHLLRTAFSSNLRSLSIHHSAITQLPTLVHEELSAMACCHLAETAILPRCEKLYPQSFIPDMNPRLTCLTLSHIPRRSTGPLIDKLITFLKLLSIQEQTIEQAKTLADSLPSSSKSPSILRGIRKVRLGFDCDPMEEDFSESADLDAEGLLDSGETGFSFFEDERPRSMSLNPEAPQSDMALLPAINRCYNVATKSNQSDDEEDFIEVKVVCCKGGLPSRLAYLTVWAGPKVPVDSPIINDYRRLVVEERLRGHVGPVTPGQILAGAPAACYIFQEAWRVAVVPERLQPPPRNELAMMKDVLEELKKYRLAGKAKYAELEERCGKGMVPPGAPHFFWTGKLEVTKGETALHSQGSQYWR